MVIGGRLDLGGLGRRPDRPVVAIGFDQLGRVPFVRRTPSRPAQGSRFWKVILDRVLARPGVSAALAAGFLLALASPVVGLHTEMLSIPQMLPASTPIVQSYDRIMTAFPGGPAPAVVVVKSPDIQAPAARQAIAALARVLARRLADRPMLVSNAVPAALKALSCDPPGG